jgi:hypothetical protein
MKLIKKNLEPRRIKKSLYFTNVHKDVRRVVFALVLDLCRNIEIPMLFSVDEKIHEISPTKY